MVPHGFAYLLWMETVPLATFNIRHGRGLDDRVDLGRTARAILDTKAEVISLQELDRGRARSGGVDQPAELAERTGLHIAFHPTVQRNESQYGIAVASRSPLETTFHRLDQVGDEEPRGLISGRLQAPGLSFIVTHLSTVARARRLQIESLLEHARRLEPPVVVMGDLNQGRWGLRRLIRAGFDAGRRIEHTLTTRSLRWQIDFVLVGPPARLAATQTITTDASDHVPLVAEVAVP